MRALPTWTFCLGMVASLASPAWAQITSPMIEIGTGYGNGGVAELVRVLRVPAEEHTPTVTYDALRDGLLGRDSTELAVQACEAGIDARTRELEEELVTQALALRAELQRQMQSVVGNLSEEDWRILRRFSHRMFSNEGFGNGTREIRERLERLAAPYPFSVRLERYNGRVEVLFDQSLIGDVGSVAGLARRIQDTSWVASSVGGHRITSFAVPELVSVATHRRLSPDTLRRLAGFLDYARSEGRAIVDIIGAGDPIEVEAVLLLRALRSAGAGLAVDYCAAFAEGDAGLLFEETVLGRQITCLQRAFGEASGPYPGRSFEAVARIRAANRREDLHAIAESEAPACAAARENLAATHLSPEVASQRFEELMELPDFVDGVVPVPGTDALDGGVPISAGVVE